MNHKCLSELIRYGITGLTTTIVNLVIYHALLLLGVDYRISNLIALVGAKLYGYIANKLFVFRTHCEGKKEIFKEILRFFFARSITWVVDYFGLIIAVEVMGFDRLVSKYVLQVFVIAINYILGKHMVFRNRSCRDANRRADETVILEEAQAGDTENEVQQGQFQEGSHRGP